MDRFLTQTFDNKLYEIAEQCGQLCLAAFIIAGIFYCLSLLM